MPLAYSLADAVVSASIEPEALGELQWRLKQCQNQLLQAI